MAALIRPNFSKIFLLSRLNVSNICQQSNSAIIYDNFGDPEKVLQLKPIPMPESVRTDEVLIRVLAAPINPADINTIQGTYGNKPKLPAIGGLEGVAEIIKVGSSVPKLKPGSWVISSQGTFGTWRKYAVCKPDEVLEIPNNLDILNAATLSVNPSTAYRMLSDFKKLKPGDTVIQNGSNSGVGQAVIQIAKSMNVKTINVIRSRPNLGSLKDYLQVLGADYVVTEEELRSPIMKEIFEKVSLPKLGLNCVGGRNALEIMKHVDKNGAFVTYGGMSKQPLTVPASILIFKNVKFYGFWMTKWKRENKLSETDSMLKYLINLINQGQFKPPASDLVAFDKFQEGIEKSITPFISRKQVLIMDEKYL